jgi:cyclin A
MREMLVDWMMEVSDEFKLKKQTFYLSVYFIDRYLTLVDNLMLE